ncbi:MAG: AMP-binding protein, partial [Stigonema ocellatum SAG 48.90 = DSM 106950]|nr:AMP-binding protein [Stigonema ocellatum SAG 48.90 = DSM 106950]
MYQKSTVRGANDDQVPPTQQRILEGIVANSTASVGQPLQRPFDDTQVEYPQDACIHSLFEAQVERSPDAVAVVLEEEHLTYRELNSRANQLAHHLQALGVKAETLVGLCVERSIEMIVSMLGILKAGGAYVPLDPGYPEERLKFMLSDSQASVLVTQKKLASLPAGEALLVCLDTDSPVISQQSQENAVSDVTADNLIYVIYTSGSTGQPKGVMIPHRGICNQLYWRQTTFGLSPIDKVLQTISLSFDPSVWQIFWPLLFGAQLILARLGGHQDTAYLV